MNETPDWSSAARVLCVRLDDIGGVLMSTPAIRALRQALPGRRITLLASKSGARAAAHIPEVDEAIGYDAPWMTRPFPPGIAADLAMRYALAMRGFDAAVIFTAPGQSPLPAATMCRLAGVPLRLAHRGENPCHPPTHEVRRQLDLVASVGARAEDERLSLQVRPQAVSCARLKLGRRLADVHVEEVVAAACDLWLDIHWRAAA